jgi:hypothetical protein
LFFSVYRNIFEACFPEYSAKKYNRMTPRHDWITKGLMKSCARKSNLYRKYCKNRSKYNKDRYIAYRNRLKGLLLKAEKSFYSDKFKSISGNIKETWKLLGTILNSNQHNDFANSFIVDGIDILDKNEIVEKFNDYFLNIGSRLAATIPNSSTNFSTYLRSSTLNSFCLFPIDAAEVVQIVSAFKNKWSAGFDCIPVNILKLSIQYVAEPISQLINSSFTTGIFPDKLKIAKVCPIFKSGEKYSFTNYRPISILSSFSKIFEKAVSNRLMPFFYSKSILIDNQFGFRPKFST